MKVKGLAKNTTQCPWPGLGPRTLNPEMSALTMRPRRLPHFAVHDLYCYIVETKIKKGFEGFIRHT